MRVLIVEDEPKLANALQEGLGGEGYDTAVEHSGEGAFFRINTETFDAVLLDLTLPGRSGLEILRALRARGLDTRVLILTARDGLDDRVLGLDTGADDYLVKPFAFAELVARLRALQRRGRSTSALHHRVADLELDLPSRTVRRGGGPVDLTAREFDLLEYLMRFSGQVVSRETLARDIWHERVRSTTMNNVIDVHVARLRKKIDQDRPVKLVHTVRGRGFTLREGSAE
jgi:two-component system copper resistance phosphate regulon response regulator CusR